MTNCRFSTLTIAMRACVAALCCGVSIASAQVIHRQVDADGRVTFTDRRSELPQPRVVRVSGYDVANALARGTAISSRGSANVDEIEAARRLGRAQLQQEQGVEPLANEATAASAEPAGQRYARRQERLRLDVEKAQARHDETQQRQLVRRAPPEKAVEIRGAQ